MVLLIMGTRESATFNVIITVAHIALVVFIIIAGFVKARPENLQPFLLPDTGVKGTFQGAAVVFFSYIGFDAVATAAEETKNPARDLPIGILGAMAIVTSLYVLMSTVLVMMIPVLEIPEGASFAVAFELVGMRWCKYIVALGALAGIITTTLVGMYGVSRIVTTVARDHLLPPLMARVHPKMRTPWIAILAQGIPSALLALFSDFADLADMVSISTLFAFWVVAMGLLWRRSYVYGRTSRLQTITLILHLLILVGSCIGFTVCFDMDIWIGLIICAAIFIAITISFAVVVKRHYTPSKFKVPLYPFLPACSVFLNIFLLGQVPSGVVAYRRFGIWVAACVALYLVFGMLASNSRDQKRNAQLPRAVTDEKVPPYAPHGVAVAR
eukprot:jgi/Chrzof1/14229/Cz08g30110.t1